LLFRPSDTPLFQDFLIGSASNIGARALQEQAVALHLVLTAATSTAAAAFAAHTDSAFGHTLTAAAASAATMAVDAAFSRCLAAITAACDADDRAACGRALAG
jgi:hypothetical protein